MAYVRFRPIAVIPHQWHFIVVTSRSLHFCAFLMIGCGLSGIADAAVQSDRGIRLSAARPRIDMPGPYNRPEVIEPQNEVILSESDGTIFGEKGIPSSVEAAVRSMQKALPREYRLGLLARYGWTRDGQQASIRRTDLRSVDLSRFLYSRWAYSHPKARLAKEWRCLVGFEGDISAFELLIAAQARHELWEEERLKPVSPLAGNLYYSAVMSAGVALQACERLVQLGWSPHKGL